jgi:hypothetical protein
MRAAFWAGLVFASTVFLWALGLTVWQAWVLPDWDAEHVLILVGTIPSAWAVISTWGWFLSYGKVSTASSTRLLLGPRPQDPLELRAWRWGRQFRYAFIIVLIIMAASAYVMSRRAG